MPTETGWQSGVQLYIVPGLPTHIVQELNAVGETTALFSGYAAIQVMPQKTCSVSTLAESRK